MKKNNPYGYKIGYRENGSLLFNRLFITRSYNHAVSMRNFYRRYEKRERNTNRPLISPFWEILPITKKEILAGIWDEIPFERYANHLINFPFGVAMVAQAKPKVKPEKNFLAFSSLRFSKNFFRFRFDFGQSNTLYFYTYFPYATLPLPEGKLKIYKE